MVYLSSSWSSEAVELYSSESFLVSKMEEREEEGHILAVKLSSYKDYITLHQSIQ